MELVKLGDIVKITSGGTPLTSKREYYEGGKIPWIKTGDLKVRHLKEVPDFITELGLANSSAKIFPINTVLIAMYGATIGNCSIMKIEAATNQACAALLPSEKINEEYLFFYLTSIKKQLIAMGIGGGQPNISATILKNISLKLPPLTTQKHIATLLSKAEALIAERKQSLLLLDEYLKATFLEMFGDPVRNEKGWEVSNIGKQCDVKGGKRIPKQSKLVKENTGYPYIKATNIKKGRVNSNELEYLTTELREKLKRYTVNKGDICITVVGVNIGDIGIVPDELHDANLTENANKLLIKNKNTLNNTYLANYLMMDFVQNLFKESIRSTGVPKLALFRIEQVELLMPPITLQLRFSNIVEKTIAMKAYYQKSLEELEAMYGSLSQRVFGVGKSAAKYEGAEGVELGMVAEGSHNFEKPKLKRK